MIRLSGWIVFQLSKEMNLKDKLRLSGVCGVLHRKIHYQNAKGDYICLKTIGTEKILFRIIEELNWTINKIGQTKLVQVAILVKSIIDINFRDDLKYTALMLAVSYNGTKIVKLLLENGAKADVLYNSGDTLLMSAARCNKLNIVNLLLDYGADINIRNDCGNTALKCVVNSCASKELISLLLKRGADVDIQNNSGDTALMEAAYYGRTYMISLFLEAGADVDIQNNSGDTAMSVAVKNDKTEIVSLLLESGED